MSHRSQYYLGGRKKYYPVGSDCVLYHAYWDGTAVDHSIYGNHGSVTGASFGEFGLTFDGIDDQVVVVDHASLDITVVNVMMWIYPTSLAQYDSYIMKSLTWTTGWGLFCNTLSPDQKVAFYTQLYTKCPSKSGLQINAWNLIEGYGGVSSRVAGIDLSYGLENTEVVANSITNNDPIKIGGQSDGGGTFPACIIGEVYVFNEVKSTEYKTTLRNSTKARYGL